jgi:DNA-directed RNA polymerase
MELVEYLREKVEKVVPDSNKVYNEGARLLATYPFWEEHLERFINEAWNTLLKYCVRNKQSTYSAAVKLTFASDLIGKRIARDMGIDETNIKSTLALGDIMLETFLQDNLIDIFREYEGKRAPYMIRITGDVDAVRPVLLGTSFLPLEPIRGLRSALTKEPYIKGWTDAKLFHNYLDAPFVRALNKIRQQGWRLNEKVLQVLTANPPPSKLDLVDRNGVIHTYDFYSDNAKLPRVLKHLDGTKFLGHKDAKIQRMMSKLFEYNQVVSKANIIMDAGEFWQEVSCDYRGRIYFAEPFLEFQGSDIARSLFLFREAKIVDERGAYWLYVHAANSYNQSYNLRELRRLGWTTTNYVEHLKKEGLDTISVDKMTLEDRYQWTKQLLDSTSVNQITSTFPKNAEKPYAFLAAMFEIKGLMETGIGNYMSALPIPIDGSNNGWQHLAAISKDKQAGSLVSLTPSKLQNDFYVAVAKDLVRLMPDWFEDRKIPMKHIRKGIAKRGSMTRAYSAGKKRIAKNMYDDCHVEGYTVKYNITEQDCEILSGNLIKAINQVCAGPLRTTKYLQKIAEHELNHGRKVLEWTTPSGFPVIYKAYLQHERKQRGTIKGIKGNKDGRIMHVVRVNVVTKDTHENVPCRKSYASGISPNFVHSMDAAHLANTINAFPGHFAAVHDSFSTHASDVDFLQEVTKKTFIAQYNVENFFEIMTDWIMLHNDSFTVDQPPLGRLDIKEVMNSEYFFC